MCIFGGIYGHLFTKCWLCWPRFDFIMKYINKSQKVSWLILFCFLLLKCCVIIVYMFSQWVHVKVSLKHCGDESKINWWNLSWLFLQKVNKKKILRSFNNTQVSLFFNNNNSSTLEFWFHRVLSNFLKIS
jgi:hypothetical protein